MAGQNHFFHPAHLTLFTVISMQTRNMSDVFIQILMTRNLDPDTGSNLKRWLQRDNFLRSQVAQATTQAQAEKNLLVQLWAEDHELL